LNCDGGESAEEPRIESLAVVLMTWKRRTSPRKPN
jgi:hypothetical protein